MSSSSSRQRVSRIGTNNIATITADSRKKRQKRREQGAAIILRGLAKDHEAMGGEQNRRDQECLGDGETQATDDGAGGDIFLQVQIGVRKRGRGAGDDRDHGKPRMAAHRGGEIGPREVRRVCSRGQRAWH